MGKSFAAISSNLDLYVWRGYLESERETGAYIAMMGMIDRGKKALDGCIHAYCIQRSGGDPVFTSGCILPCDLRMQH